MLVINSGSSSIKFSVFDGSTPEPRSVYEGEIARFGTNEATLEVGGVSSQAKADSAAAATTCLLNAIAEAKFAAIQAVGYRVVHPGTKITTHVRVTDEVLHQLELAKAFAPLHEPVALEIMREVMAQLPDVPHFACFDTVFHETMPEEAKTYALPRTIRDAGVRRYGFHGLSCESIVRRYRIAEHTFPRRAIIAHLGSGCSVTALVDGCSIDTTMGLTPDGGVVMGTRPGDLDPGVVLYLLRGAEGSTEGRAAAVEAMLNRDSGMVALSGLKNDVKALREAAGVGDLRAIMALKVFTRSVRKAIGGFVWLLGGIDAIIFSGGVGEHDSATWTEVLSGLDALGLRLERDSLGRGVRRITAAEAATAVWVVPSEEDLMIALHMQEMMHWEFNASAT